jgi:hypothetical protein
VGGGSPVPRPITLRVKIESIFGIFMAQRYLRRGLRRLGLFPTPITDEIVSEIVLDYCHQKQLYPRWGSVNFFTFPPSQFDARGEMEQAVKGIAFYLTGQRDRDINASSVCVKPALRRHGLMPPQKSN